MPPAYFTRPRTSRRFSKWLDSVLRLGNGGLPTRLGGVSYVAMASLKDVLQHAFARSYVKMADVAELAEIDDTKRLLVLANWIVCDEDKCTWEIIEFFRSGRCRPIRWCY